MYVSDTCDFHFSQDVTWNKRLIFVSMGWLPVFCKPCNSSLQFDFSMFIIIIFQYVLYVKYNHLVNKLCCYIYLYGNILYQTKVGIIVKN